MNARQHVRMSRTLKRHYLLALVCCLSIPAAMFAGAGLFALIDPEMARGHADYVRDYRLLETARQGVLVATAGLMLALWLSVCYLVIESRQRSPLWLLLAVAGPFGFTIIAMLEDCAPVPDDAYQQFIRNLKMYWRIALEIAVSASVWFLAFGAVVIRRELTIGYESFSTGTPVAEIVARQSASSGMWAFREGLEAAYLVVLIYLLWPIFFNLAVRFVKRRANPAQQAEREPGG